MIKALIDTNVILDIALKREPFFEYSSMILIRLMIKFWKDTLLLPQSLIFITLPANKKTNCRRVNFLLA